MNSRYAVLFEPATIGPVGGQQAACETAGIQGIWRIGDCLAPGTPAAAVYSGHQLAREFDREPVSGLEVQREFPVPCEE